MTSWEELKKKCLSCTDCGLHEHRSNVVFGVGNQNAEILFVGEAPGEQEDRLAEPFVGRSGKLLDEMLSTIGLYRSTNIYITNIVKCRPPKNRDPKLDESSRCIAWLNAQVELMSPKIIVCLGRIAAAKLIEKDFKITLNHGVAFEKNKTWYMALFHPAAILRNPKLLPTMQGDLDKLKRLLV